MSDKEGVQKSYLKAMGSVCYNRRGITYPIAIMIGLEQVLEHSGAFNIKWECQFGWSNQPEVLTFEWLELGQSLPEHLYFYGLRVVDYWED